MARVPSDAYCRPPLLAHPASLTLFAPPPAAPPPPPPLASGACSVPPPAAARAGQRAMRATPLLLVALLAAAAAAGPAAGTQTAWARVPWAGQGRAAGGCRGNATLPRLAPPLTRTPPGALISTATYSCDPAACKPPKCLCAYNNPPGGLAPSQVPQFVLVRVCVCGGGGAGCWGAAPAAASRAAAAAGVRGRAAASLPSARPPTPPPVQISHAGSLQLEAPGPGPDGQGSSTVWVTMEAILRNISGISPNGEPWKNKNGCPVPVTWCARRRVAPGALPGDAPPLNTTPRPTPRPQVCRALPLAVQGGRPGARRPPRDCHAGTEATAAG